MCSNFDYHLFQEEDMMNWHTCVEKSVDADLLRRMIDSNPA